MCKLTPLITAGANYSTQCIPFLHTCVHFLPAVPVCTQEYERQVISFRNGCETCTCSVSDQINALAVHMQELL